MPFANKPRENLRSKVSFEGLRTPRTLSTTQLNSLKWKHFRSFVIRQEIRGDRVS
jgi:hypothetical protein